MERTTTVAAPALGDAFTDIPAIGPAGAENEVARAVDALRRAPAGKLKLPPALMRVYLETRWKDRRAMLVAWFVAIAAINALALLFDPFIVPAPAAAGVIAGRSAISAMFLLCAVALRFQERTGVEGVLVVGCSIAAIAVSAVVGLQAGPGHFERLVSEALFAAATSIVVARVAWRETVVLAALICASVVALAWIAPALSTAQRLQMVAFYASAITALTFARQVQNQYLYRMFVMGLNERVRMSEIESLNGQLSSLARTDPLTAVANRRHFDEVFGGLKLGVETPPSVALFMIDIDYFKRLNDDLGHEVGDECLKVVAGVIRSELRADKDFLARFGGEEFVALLPETPRAGAEAVAERVRAAVAERGLANPSGLNGVVTVSIGVALSPPCDLLELIAAADAALYDAKSQGRDKVQVAGSIAGTAIP